MAFLHNQQFPRKKTAWFYQCTGCGRCILLNYSTSTDDVRPLRCHEDRFNSTDLKKHRWAFRGSVEFPDDDVTDNSNGGAHEGNPPGGSGVQVRPAPLTVPLVVAPPTSSLDTDSATPPPDTDPPNPGHSSSLQHDFSALVADITKLEALLAQFNLFEAIGTVRQEVRHSRLLAHLLDPQGAHGLGDAFLRCFLQGLIDSAPVGMIHPRVMDVTRLSLDQATVLAEWEYVDLLVTVEAHELVVLIENKIDSREHSEQLPRYLANVRGKHPGWTVIPVFLSPDGTPPSLSEFIPVSYDMIYAALRELLEAAFPVNPEVRVVIEHYLQMLRRHIMNDSDIAILCREIYQKHSKALELIFQHRRDAKATLSAAVFELVENNESLQVVNRRADKLNFTVAHWDRSPILRKGEMWPSGCNRVLAFQFFMERDALSLKLWVGPVPSGEEETRERLKDMARRNGAPFAVRNDRQGFCSIFERRFLRQADYLEGESGELISRVRMLWDEFLAEELPDICRAISSETWIWTDSE